MLKLSTVVAIYVYNFKVINNTITILKMMFSKTKNGVISGRTDCRLRFRAFIFMSKYMYLSDQINYGFKKYPKEQFIVSLFPFFRLQRVF